jgi:hypothetical protein
MTGQLSTRPALDVVSAPMYERIGEITVYFAMLETILGGSIGRLLFRDDRSERSTGAVVTAELSFRSKLALLASTYRLRLPAASGAELKALCDRLERVEAERNQVIHSVWTVRSDGIYRQKVSATRKRTRIADELFTPQRLEEMRERIAVLAADLKTFVNGAVATMREEAQGSGV